MEVTVLMDGLMPYAGYTPVMAAVWDTHAAGSMGRIGSPVESNRGRAVTVGDLTRAAHLKRWPCMCECYCNEKEKKVTRERNTYSWAERSSSEGSGPSTWPRSE